MKEYQKNIKDLKVKDEGQYKMFFTFLAGTSPEDIPGLFQSLGEELSVVVSGIEDLSNLKEGRKKDYTMFKVVVFGSYPKVYEYFNEFRERNFASLDLLEKTS